MFSNWHRDKRRTFGFRLNLWFAAVLVLLSTTVFLTGYFLLSQSIAAKDREVVRAQLDVYRAWYQDGGLGELSEHFSQRDDSGKESFFVRVTGNESNGLFISLPRQSAQFDLTTLDKINLAKPLTWLTLPSQDQSTNWLIATTLLPDGDRLEVGKTTEAQTALLKHFQFVFGSAVVIAIVLGLAGGSLLAHRALAPIRQLITGLQQVITTGKFDQRIPVRMANDELTQLATLFNLMLEKNAGLIRGMREALDNVAHDLRTPLARLRATAEIALQSPEDVAVFREALSDSLEESDRVLTMLTTLMDISEAEVGLMKLEPVKFNLAGLIAAVIELYQLVAEDKGIKVTMKVPKELTCVADPNRLRQVLVNLLDNALKYTPNGGEVQFTAHVQGAELIIEVKDNGMGIASEELPRIWERLYRGDKSRAQRGLGLGLSLVKAVVEAHLGGVGVTSDVGNGSIFTVILPAGDPSQPV
ncbi:MAG TPA: HAMP domain-containing sensor histidine kinase [Tepidisphaeraceae bacterium]|jgi:signal transduction histidine kinase|nr:HAMP domain-containing sensor histidine kinase [Tepidisphaeraceae bacterium]